MSPVVAAIQCRRYTFTSPLAWARAREPLIAQAASRGAVLAVLAGSPGWDEVFDDALAAASDLALKYRITLVAEVGYERDEEMRTYRAASVFAPDGALLGSQRQVNLSPEDMAGMLTAGERLAPIDTPAGYLGILLGADVDAPGAGREMASMGATLLVHIGERRGPPGDALPCRLRAQVAASGLTGIEACPVGAGSVGGSCILAPGRVLASAPDASAEAVVLAEIAGPARP